MRAQVSLEFLLLLLAFFSVFALLLPFYSNAYHASVFAVDSFNAKKFVDSINEAISKLGVLGNDSSFEIKARPVLHWKIFSEKNELFVAVKNPALAREKTFSVKFPNEIDFFSEIDSQKNFFVKKSGGLVYFGNSE